MLIFFYSWTTRRSPQTCLRTRLPTLLPTRTLYSQNRSSCPHNQQKILPVQNVCLGPTIAPQVLQSQLEQLVKRHFRNLKYLIVTKYLFAEYCDNGDLFSSSKGQWQNFIQGLICGQLRHSVWKSPKMSHLNFFSILAFSTNFCPIKTDLSGNTVWPQDLGFQKLAKLDHFGHF